MAESASGQSEADPVFWLVTVYLSGQDKLYKQRRFWATHVNRKWTLFLSGIFAQIFGQIVPIIGKRPRKTYLVLSIYFKMKKMSFPVDVRCSKSLCLISLMTKLVRSRWLDFGFVLFCLNIVLDLTVHKSEKKNLVSIQPYWPQAWSINLHTSLPHGITQCVNSPNRCHFVSLFTPPPPSTRPP